MSADLETNERPGPPPMPEFVRYEIRMDGYSESPRSWDNLGTIAVTDRFTLSNQPALADNADCMIEQTWLDAMNQNGWRKMVERIEDDVGATVVLPIKQHPAGGLEVGTLYDFPMSDDGFDAIVYDTNDARMKMCAWGSQHEVAQWITEEVKTLQQWLQGDVFEYAIIDNGVSVDGCGGYYNYTACQQEAEERALAINQKRFKAWKKELDEWGQAPETVTIPRSQLKGKRMFMHEAVYEIHSFTGEQIHLRKVKEQ